MQADLCQTRLGWLSDWTFGVRDKRGYNVGGVWKASLLSGEEAMRSRNVAGLMLFVMLLLLAQGSGPVRGAQPSEPGKAVGADASSLANAPWVKMELDTVEDTGQNVSVAIDPYFGGVNVGYYNATDGDLRMAHFLGPGQGDNCGPDDTWYCQTVDSQDDVGQYSSIAAAAGGVGIAYHDATSGDLKFATSSDRFQTANGCPRASQPAARTGVHGWASNQQASE